MPKYENGVIYKLKHNLDYDDENIYIGSTTNFKHRKNDHKTCCNNINQKGHNLKVYKYIRENGGFDEWIMIQIQEYPCNSKKELETRERYYIDLFKSTLNKVIPTRTDKEYKQNNCDKIAEYLKEYRQNNRDKITEKRKVFYQDNRDKILEKNKEYRQNNRDKIIEKKKEYRQNNRDKVLEKDKKYYQNNSDKVLEKQKKYRQENCDKIAERAKEKVICDHCGCEIRKYGLKRHQQSKKCIDSTKD